VWLRATVHGNDAAKKPGGVHTITAPDGTGPRSCAPLARGGIVDARVPQVSGSTLARHATSGFRTNEDGLKMLTLPVWAIVAALCAIVIWIAVLVRGLNDRFDQIDHALDLVLDHLKDK